MEKRPKPIGEILVGLGLITPLDVDRALEHQRERGGFFGDALVSLGLVTTAEVNWGLADQFDLPFVQPRPEDIDRAVALAVPVAWAREHLILPVLRNGDTVTVVLAAPQSRGRLDEVRRFTGAARVEAALASPETVAELIGAVHGETEASTVPLHEFLAEALAAGASRVGVSAWRDEAEAWYPASTPARRRLAEGWSEELRARIVPFPTSERGRVVRWSAALRDGERVWRVECALLADSEVTEWAARIGPRIPVAPDSVVVDRSVAALLDERLRGEGATARMGKGTHQERSWPLELVLPLFPRALRGERIRSVHLCDAETVAPRDIPCVRVGDSLESSLRDLEPFGLQALTLDVERLSADELEWARRVAPLVAFRTRSPSTHLSADLELCLHSDGDRLCWGMASGAAD